MDSLLSIARKTKARVFQASTSEVYGHPSVHPQTESYWGYVNPMGPRACYDEGKRCAETLCFIYREEFGVPVRVSRIFNTYGPRMHPSDGRVVVNFIMQSLRNEAITVYGDGTQTRSFCYVDDLIEGILTMMSDENECAGPINLGNPTEVTVLELAQRIIDITGSRSRIELRPLPTDDPPRRRPDISIAQEVLGWKPQTDLATGLIRTIAYFEAELRHGKYASRPESNKRRGAPRRASIAGADVA
jgi:UDP-glucuronate decarboxylase